MNDTIHDKIASGAVDPDLGIKVGDIITAYHGVFATAKGFHVVTRVERRFHDQQRNNRNVGDPQSSLIHYKRMFNASGKKSASRIACCDAAYCKVVDEKLLNEIFEEETKAAYDKWCALKLALVDNGSIKVS